MVRIKQLPTILINIASKYLSGIRNKICKVWRFLSTPYNIILSLLTLLSSIITIIVFFHTTSPLNKNDKRDRTRDDIEYTYRKNQKNMNILTYKNEILKGNANKKIKNTSSINIYKSHFFKICSNKYNNFKNDIVSEILLADCLTRNLLPASIFYHDILKKLSIDKNSSDMEKYIYLKSLIGLTINGENKMEDVVKFLKDQNINFIIRVIKWNKFGLSKK